MYATHVLEAPKYDTPRLEGFHMLQVLRRKLPMAWGTTTDKVIAEINPFLYARETKHLTLKDLETYLILDG